jgi:hypothetical protein
MKIDRITVKSQNDLNNIIKLMKIGIRFNDSNYINKRNMN